MKYDVVVGLEVHAELATETKIYCGCKNSFGSAVNSNVCPVCAGLPGTLPVLNKKVVELAVKAGLALNCKISKKSKQDRKNYFYPDLPKGYQISQHEIPLCYDGYVDIILDETGATKRIRIRRIHIEEDAGKLIHDKSTGVSLLDLNRSGVPLIEIVSEPDISNAKEAKIYLETIKAILQSLQVCNGKMQEGSIRCDVNVSLKPKDSQVLGTRCEMKNVSTFGGTVRAINYEVERQTKILEEGGQIFQETRRWDDEKGENVLLRTKEDAQDYRYFPEPDLLAIVVDEETIENIKNNLPELPNVRTKRFISDYNLSMIDAVTLVNDFEKADLFEKCAQNFEKFSKNDPKSQKNEKCDFQGNFEENSEKNFKKSAKTFSNWLLGDISRLLNERKVNLSETNLDEKKLIEVVRLINSGEISNTCAKVLIENLMFTEKEMNQIISENNLIQVSDKSELEKIVKKVLEENPQIKEMFEKGKTNIIGFAVGQCMKLSKGQGNPQMLRDMILENIK